MVGLTLITHGLPVQMVPQMHFPTSALSGPIVMKMDTEMILMARGGMHVRVNGEIVAMLCSQ